MGVTKRGMFERAKKLERVAELALEGKTTTEIAKEFGCTREMISYDFKRLFEAYDINLKDAVETLVEKLVGNLQVAAYESFEAWQKSKEGTYEVKTEMDGAQQPTKIIKTERHNGPTTEYLKCMAECYALIAKMMDIGATPTPVNNMVVVSSASSRTEGM